MIHPFLMLLIALAGPLHAEPASEAADEAALARNPLAPVRTESPRDTLRSFMASMQRYRDQLRRHPSEASEALKRAVRTMDLEGTPALFRAEKGRETAIFLKEVIDRVAGIDYSKIPNEAAFGASPPIRWRLPDTEITLLRQSAGERSGEYLFSQDTVARSKEFFFKVRSLPYLAGSGRGALYAEPWLELEFPEWARHRVVWLPNWKWVALGAAFVLGFIMRIGVSAIGKLALRLLSRTRFRKSGLTRSLIRPVAWGASGIVWLLSLHVLRIEGPPLPILTFLVQAHLSIVSVWALYVIVDNAMGVLVERASGSHKVVDDHLMPLVRRSMRVVLLMIGGLVALQNMGFNVMSVVAGLGLGGLAFALAAQDTVANLFGSAMIFLDRPFSVGDAIKVGNVEGIVEEIGFRSTRIRTGYDSLISVPNKSVASSDVDNLGRRSHRRTSVRLGLTYDTTPEKMEQFVEGVRKIIAMHPATRKEAYQVSFDGFGDSALEVAVTFFVTVATYDEELMHRQGIFMEFLRLAKSVGVSYAFPTRTVHVESVPKGSL